MPLTLEERERIAYIEGRTEEAAVLACAVDADALDEAIGDKEAAEQERDEANAEYDRLEKELEAEADKVERLEAENNELREQIHAAALDLV